MKKFTYTGLWNILLNPNDANTSFVQMNPEVVLDDFTTELQGYCREEKDFAERIRTLRFACNELTSVLERPYNGSEKKRSYPNNYKESCFSNRLRT